MEGNLEFNAFNKLNARVKVMARMCGYPPGSAISKPCVEVMIDGHPTMQFICKSVDHRQRVLDEVLDTLDIM